MDGIEKNIDEPIIRYILRSNEEVVSIMDDINERYNKVLENQRDLVGEIEDLIESEIDPRINELEGIKKDLENEIELASKDPELLIKFARKFRS